MPALGIALGLSFGNPAATGGAAAPSVPVNTVLPAISGPNNPPQVGDTLTTTNGTWTGESLEFTYTWQRRYEGEWGTIPDAALQTYETTIDDLTATLRVQITATNAIGSSAAANSEATATVQPPAPLPEITTVDFTGLDGGSFDVPEESPGRYFLISDAVDRIAVWFQPGAQVQPDASGEGATKYICVDSLIIDPGSTASQLANALASYLTNDSEITAVADGAVVTATDDADGDRQDVADGANPTGAALSVTQQGRD